MSPAVSLTLCVHAFHNGHHNGHCHHQHISAKGYMRNERYDEAATALRRCSALEPTNVGVMYNLGVAYEKQNNLNESVDWLIKVKVRKCAHASVPAARAHLVVFAPTRAHVCVSTRTSSHSFSVMSSCCIKTTRAH